MAALGEDAAEFKRRLESLLATWQPAPAIRGQVDVILANDPDADRLGVVLKHQGEWLQMTGNDMAALTLDYLARFKHVKGAVVTTVVTSGASEAVDICLTALLNPGDEILTPCPDYPLY